MSSRPLSVAVVGATGVVGKTMIQVLIEREFPLGEIRLLASGKAGRTIDYGRRQLPVGEATPHAFDGIDIALFSAGADVSIRPAPCRTRRVCMDSVCGWGASRPR
jgi:aspartate-semialdehyde dehydrogenase